MTNNTRAAIVGTFTTWTQTPWNDPDLYIVSLNDAYTLGIPRANEWYEIHPLDKMWFRDPRVKIVDPRHVPKDSFIRPKGHIEWLKKQAETIPVWLKDEPPAGWPPNAQRFPVEDLDAKYGAYWASGPAYILMHLYERGFREFHIYGIHLATQHEYIEQRPNWEFLLGRLLGPEVTTTVKGDVRIYDGSSGVRVMLPISCPILAHSWKYAYEPKPKPPADPFAEEWKSVQQEKDALVRALVQQPTHPDRAKRMERLQRLEIIEIDIQQQRAQRSMGATLTAKLMVA